MGRHVWLKLLVVLSLVAALALTVTACGGDSPGDTVKKYFDNISSGDFGAVYDLLSKDSPARKQYSRDEFVEMAKEEFPQGATISNYSVLEEKIDGDRATVKFRATLKAPDAPEDTDEDTISLVKEDGKWKLLDE